MMFGLILPGSLLLNDRNSEIEKCIQWADDLYETLCGNKGWACAMLVYKNNILKRVFYYIINGEMYAREETVGDRIDDTILPEEQLAEIIKNGFITVKRY